MTIFVAPYDTSLFLKDEQGGKFIRRSPLLWLTERRARFQVDTSTRNPESVKQGYLFEVPVQKWSRTERAFKFRLLALTKSSVVEMDVATRSGLLDDSLLYSFLVSGDLHCFVVHYAF